jgi:hypothetical protein
VLPLVAKATSEALHNASTKGSVHVIVDVFGYFI